MRRLSNEVANELLEASAETMRVAIDLAQQTDHPGDIATASVVSGLHANLWVGVEILHRMGDEAKKG